MDPLKSSSFPSTELYDPYQKPPGPYNMLPPRPVRRYSSQWWSRAWDREVARKWLPRIIYVVVGFALMGAWVGVVFTFADKETKHQKSNRSRDKDMLIERNLTDNLMFKGMLRKFDAESRTLSVQWSAVSPQDDSLTNFEAFPEENATEVWPFGVYRDVKVIYDEEANLTAVNEGEILPLRLDNRTAPRLGVLGAHSWDTVDVDVDMTASNEGDVWEEPLFGYPWDEWSGNIVFAIAYNLTNGSDCDWPAGTTIEGHILNWKIEASSDFVDSCNTSLPFEQWNCGLEVKFTARRPGIVIFCVITVVVINWLSTIAIFLVTGEAILLRRAHILEGTDMLGVCFAALFALPSVRSLLPGAPFQFGAVIDLIGILPNVIIISLCTFVFCAAKLRMRLKMAMAGGSR